MWKYGAAFSVRAPPRLWMRVFTTVTNGLAGIQRAYHHQHAGHLLGDRYGKMAVWH